MCISPNELLKEPCWQLSLSYEGEELLSKEMNKEYCTIHNHDYFQRFICQTSVLLFNQNKSVFWLLSSSADSDDCEHCAGVLEELENIDDDCDRHGITFVKTQVNFHNLS